MKYTKFEDWMIGKKVRADYRGDRESTGTITREFEANYTDGVWVLWNRGSNANEELWLEFEDFVFVDENPSKPFEEITIDGKRYKLTEIEE